MIYVKKEYKNYKYLVSASDNYVVLTDTRYVYGTWDNTRTIDIIYQYINSPLTVIEAERNYNTTVEFQEIETSQNIMDSPAYTNLMRDILILVMFLIYIINVPTKMVKKGGMFFGS